MNYLIHQLLNTEEINLIKKELEKCSQEDWENGKTTPVNWNDFKY